MKHLTQVKQFMVARKMFVGRITKELLQLMDVSIFYRWNITICVSDSANSYTDKNKNGKQMIFIKIWGGGPPGGAQL